MNHVRPFPLVARWGLGLPVLVASPVAVNGHLLLTSEEGDTFVVKAGPEFEIVGRNPLDEPVGASAAVVGGRIYVRGHEHLFAIGDASAS